MTRIISSTGFAKFAKATAVTVYFMTGVKAAVRPTFIMTDKRNKDKEAKKYTAVKEGLYQVLCLGFAFAMIPFFEKGGFKLAEKQFGKIAELSKNNITKLSHIDEFKEVAKTKGFNLKGFKDISKFKEIYLNKSFDENYVSQIENVKPFKKNEIAGPLSPKEENTLVVDEAMHLINGGVETGSLIGSIIGLTVMAPLISHEILHPIMHALGFNKKESDNPALEKLQQPILEEGHHKVDTKA